MADKKNDWMRLASIGPHFMISVLIGFFIGRKLDAWLDAKPLWTLIFVLMGIAAGFLNLFRELALVNKAEQEERDRADSEFAETEDDRKTDARETDRGRKD